MSLSVLSDKSCSFFIKYFKLSSSIIADINFKNYCSKICLNFILHIKFMCPFPLIEIFDFFWLVGYPNFRVLYHHIFLFKTIATGRILIIKFKIFKSMWTFSLFITFQNQQYNQSFAVYSKKQNKKIF